MQDRVSRPTSGLVQQLWHLPAGTSMQFSGRSAAIGTSADGAMQTVVLQVPLPGDVLPKGATTAITGQTSPLQGWVSTKNNEFVKAPTVVTSRGGTSARMVTLVVGVPTGTSVSASAVASGKQLRGDRRRRRPPHPGRHQQPAAGCGRSAEQPPRLSSPRTTKAPPDPGGAFGAWWA